MDPTKYRARAGALTLMYMAGSADRHVLLQALAEAMSDEKSVELDPDELPDPEYVMDPGLGPAALSPVDADVPIGPDTPMKITPAGREMLYISSVIERWLRNCPEQPLELGTEGSAVAVAALAYGWSATAVHAIAREPASLPEMSRAIDAVGYDTLERHVELMEAAGQAQAHRQGGEIRYAATEWLREGIAPLAAAARLECRYPAPDTAPADGLDVEAGFFLALPQLRLPAELSGKCRLGIQLEGDLPRMAGVTAHVEGGRVVLCAPHLDEDAGTWASAPLVDWLDTLIDPSKDRIESGGDAELAGALLTGLHETLFGIQVL